MFLGHSKTVTLSPRDIDEYAVRASFVGGELEKRAISSSNIDESKTTSKNKDKSCKKIWFDFSTFTCQES